MKANLDVDQQMLHSWLNKLIRSLIIAFHSDRTLMTGCYMFDPSIGYTSLRMNGVDHFW